jgi:hypothetical protein
MSGNREGMKVETNGKRDIEDLAARRAAGFDLWRPGEAPPAPPPPPPSEPAAREVPPQASVAAAPTVADVVRQLATLCESVNGPVRFRVPVAGLLVRLVVQEIGSCACRRNSRLKTTEIIPPGPAIVNGIHLGKAARRIVSVCTDQPQTSGQIARKLGRIPGCYIDRQVRELCRMRVLERLIGGGYVLRR